MASLNKVILIGNLGRDPEVRYMPNGEAVCNFSIATTDKWKDKNGQQQERTEWHNIVLYRKLAEIAGEYLKTGSQVYIEGRLHTHKWQDKTSGQDRYTTQVIAQEMKMLGGRTSDSAQKSTQQNNGAGDYERASTGGASRPPQRPANAKPQSFDDFEDDIPF